MEDPVCAGSSRRSRSPGPSGSGPGHGRGPGAPRGVAAGDRAGPAPGCVRRTAALPRLGLDYAGRHAMAGHHLHQHVEVSDDGRTVAAAEVIISGESGGTAGVSLRAEAGQHAAVRSWLASRRGLGLFPGDLLQVCLPVCLVLVAGLAMQRPARQPPPSQPRPAQPGPSRPSPADRACCGCLRRRASRCSRPS